MNSTEQRMNSTKQCINSELIWGYCSRAGKKKKNMYVRKRGMQTVTMNLHGYTCIVVYFIVFLRFWSVLLWERNI